MPGETWTAPTPGATDGPGNDAPVEDTDEGTVEGTGEGEDSGSETIMGGSRVRGHRELQQVSVPDGGCSTTLSTPRLESHITHRKHTVGNVTIYSRRVIRIAADRPPPT
jgi:hypothetical protein